MAPDAMVVGDAMPADASADGGAPELHCAVDEVAVGTIERGSENGLERVIALAELDGDLAAVWTSRAEVTLVRVPERAPAIHSTIATSAERPSWPTALVVDGVLHAAWVEVSEGVRHARARGAAWDVGTVARAEAGALVRGTTRVEAVWIAEDGRVQLASRGEDGEWTSVATPAFTHPGAGPVEALRDGAGRLHLVHAADGVVRYAGEASPDWRTATVVREAVVGAPTRFEASLAVFGEAVLVGHATRGSAGLWRLDDDDFFVRAGAPVTGLRDGLGIALTDDGVRSHAVYAYWAAGGAQIRTPVSLAVGDEAPRAISTRAYAFSPAALWVGDTLHVMWAEWSGIGSAAFVRHARCSAG